MSARQGEIDKTNREINDLYERSELLKKHRGNFEGIDSDLRDITPKMGVIGDIWQTVSQFHSVNQFKADMSLADPPGYASHLQSPGEVRSGDEQGILSLMSCMPIVKLTPKQFFLTQLTLCKDLYRHLIFLLEMYVEQVRSGGI